MSLPLIHDWGTNMRGIIEGRDTPAAYWLWSAVRYAVPPCRREYPAAVDCWYEDGEYPVEGYAVLASGEVVGEAA